MGSVGVDTREGIFPGKSDVSWDLKGEEDFARKAEGKVPLRGNYSCKGRRHT